MTMKEAIVSPDTSVMITDSPYPTPGPGEVLVKVVVAGEQLYLLNPTVSATNKLLGTNPKDWKFPLWDKKAHDSGDDLAGVVEAVGDDVLGFSKGQRVAGFHIA